MYKYLFFDLDGTLTESGEGITNAAAYTFEKLGMAVPSKEELFSFVGPPLSESFPKFGIPVEKTDEVIKVFREYYNTRGWCENRPYPGIPEMCARLADCGYKLIVATSKRESQAVKIMDYFGLAPFFTDVIGSVEEEGRAGKSDVIRFLLDRHGITDNSEVVMIGDRNYDVKGAAACGIETVGVTYGYGTREELEEAGAIKVFDTVEELSDFFAYKK